MKRAEKSSYHLSAVSARQSSENGQKATYRYESGKITTLRKTADDLHQTSMRAQAKQKVQTIAEMTKRHRLRAHKTELVFKAFRNIFCAVQHYPTQ
jgi:hypothetical protein